MTDKILKYMEEYHMLPENGNIVVGVSGGADSVCLLYALVKLRDGLKPALRLAVVHVNHGLREEAAADAAFVEELCRRWGVPFFLVEEDVEKLAEERHLSCEEAGRAVRYRAFAQALAEMDGSAAQSGECGSAAQNEECGSAAQSGECGNTAQSGECSSAAQNVECGSAAQNGEHVRSGRCGCIAVAHNSDDRAETFLFHLLRGTGLAGMGSIRPVRENADGSRIIRPLLSVSRQEIEAFLQREGLEWRTDHTNAQELYTRNRIRNRILPYAEAEICGQAKEHLAREAVLLAKTADFVERRTQEALLRCAQAFWEEEELRFAVDAFLAEEEFLQDQMLWRAIGQVGRQKDLTAAHVAEVKKLFAASCTSGRRVELPVLQISARRQFGQVILKRSAGAAEARSAADRDAVPVVPGVFHVPGLGKVCARLLPGPEGADFEAFLKNIPEKKYTKWLDYDKILESAIFRTRRTGDYLTIDDALSKKSLKRYLIEEKIPAHKRDELMLLADGAHVIWVVGYRISAAYKVTADTATILEVRCEPPEAGCGADQT